MPVAAARILVLDLVIAAAYSAAAKVGFRLAFVAEQVTTVLGACIAVAALLLGGFRFWPAIWLGAFTANAPPLLRCGRRSSWPAAIPSKPLRRRGSSCTFHGSTSGPRGGRRSAIEAVRQGLGSGATSTIRLPRALGPAAEIDGTPPVSGEPPLTSLLGMNVLLVDDEPDTLTMFRNVLETPVPACGRPQTGARPMAS